MISLNLCTSIKFYVAIVFAEGRFSNMRGFSRTRRLAGSDKNERGNSSIVEKRAANEQGEFPGTGTRFSSRSKKTVCSNAGERKRERKRGDPLGIRDASFVGIVEGVVIESTRGR